MSHDLKASLDQAVGQYPLLEHPFYKAWAAGTLTTEDLGFYSKQYWRQVEAFPGYLSAVALRIESEAARSIVESNLRDEVEDDHPGLWVEFAASLGVARDDLESSGIEEETRTCVESFGSASRTESVPFALGMLYGYESQTPEVAATKIRGLHDHYGIADRGTKYFELHGVLDIAHARDMATAIESVCADESAVEQAVAGAEAGAKAIWTLLDGVARERKLTPAC